MRNEIPSDNPFFHGKGTFALPDKNLDEILLIKDKYPDLRKSIDRDIEIEDELANNEIILPEKQKRKINPLK